MKIDRIEINDYRNINKIELLPNPNINIIYGDNAQGKTNLMEAIWLFTGNSSFRGSLALEMIMFEKEKSMLFLSFSDRERTQKAELFLGNKKKITLNSVKLKSASELNGNFYAVVFSPSHLSFIKDGPKNRRKFIDIAISQIKPQYNSYIQRYEKLINQRNALLKNSNNYKNIEKDIEIWDEQISKVGTIISIYRNDYIKKLEKFAKNAYEGISSHKESFSIYYNSTIFEDINMVTSYTDEWVKKYKEELYNSLNIDIKNGSTSFGIHKDDLEVTIDGISARKYGSQGQQRSAVIALKLAEAQLLKRVTGENPIMLLDDVMSELDISRQNYILNNLKDMQVFITCCDINNTNSLKEGAVFHIVKGQVIT